MDPRTLPLRGLAAILLLSSPALCQGASGVTERVSLDESGLEATEDSSHPSISEDGRYVAFESYSALFAGEVGFFSDVYVHDRWTGTVECASRTAAGVFGNNNSERAHISADGRWVVFHTWATNFEPLDGNIEADVYLKDMQTGALTRVSNAWLSPFSGEASSYDASVSDDGRYVAFASYAEDLVVGDTNSAPDVFVRDMQTGQTQRISEGVLGQANSGSGEPMISGDGNSVAFSSAASNLVLFDGNGSIDIFVWRTGFLPKLVSRSTNGSPGNDHSVAPSISGDGARVAFESDADDLVAGDVNAARDIFVVDVDTVSMQKASVTSIGNELNDGSYLAAISRNGQVVSFFSQAEYAPNGGSDYDVFVRDLEALETWTASRPSGTALQPIGESRHSALAQGGATIAFSSDATNLVPGDTNNDWDVFVREMHTDPFEYCAGASVTIQGCQPNLTPIGYPSVSSGAFFTILGDSLPNQRSGLLFYGFDGAASKPWGGSTMCVEGAKKRTPLMGTNGNPVPANDCSGFFAYDMNGFAAGALGGNPHALLSSVGQVVNLQFWGREGPTGTYLSTAIEYVVGP